MITDLVCDLREMSRIYTNAAPARQILLDAADALEAKGKLDTDNKPFWIVMALDNRVPVERGLGGYVRQPDEATAKSEARRLAEIHGGRFAVLRVMSIIGWQEVQMDKADLEIPF